MSRICGVRLLEVFSVDRLRTAHVLPLRLTRCLETSPLSWPSDGRKGHIL